MICLSLSQQLLFAQWLQKSFSYCIAKKQPVTKDKMISDRWIAVRLEPATSWPLHPMEHR
jgi:hypothetical protein